MSTSPTPDRDPQSPIAPHDWASNTGREAASGDLLVAMPGLTDPNFSHTVILLLEHSTEGTVGVVLNRPSEVKLEHVLPTWAPLATGSDVFHLGGPCQTDTALCLARGQLPDSPTDLDARAELAGLGLRPTGSGIYLADLDVEPDPAGGRISDIRVFAGYAGWSPGQLDDEIADGAWLCVPADPRDVFAAVPDRLWRSVLSRQDGPLAVLRSAPADPTTN